MWFLSKQINQFLVKFIYLKFHNLKKVLLFDRSFYLVRTNYKIRKHFSKLRQIMATSLNSKTSNKNGASAKKLRSGSTANCKPNSRKEEKEETSRSSLKESISSKNPSKQSNQMCASVVNPLQLQGCALYPNQFLYWPSAYNSYQIPVTSLLRQRSLSDSLIQPQLDLVYLNNVATTHRSYNRYRMRRSDALDKNTTEIAQRDKQLALTLREWQRTLFGKKTSKQKISRQSCRFKIMSYNVLAQDLLTEHSYLYRHHNSEALQWEQRWSNLLLEIRQHEPDILCLQEVQASHIQSYYNGFKSLGYEGIFKQRTGIRIDGCAIYYKKSAFNLVEHTTVEFNQSRIPILNRDNVAVILKLAPKNNPKNEFVVATTHLLYNPKREDVRLAQTQVLLSEIDRMSFKKIDSKSCRHLPIILTGDFNLTPNSVVYELITQGRLNYEHLSNRSLTRVNSTQGNMTGKSLLPSSLRITDQCQHADLLAFREQNRGLSREEELNYINLQHSERNTNNCKCSIKQHRSMFSSGTLSHYLALKSAYEHRYGNQIEATTYQDKWVTVDYIFYSGVKDEDEGDIIKEDKLKLMSRYTLPTAQQLQDVRIPNFVWGSDHLCLVVKFQLDP